MADGQVIYSGPADKAVDYFVSYGYECPEYTNPADCKILVYIYFI